MVSEKKTIIGDGEMNKLIRKFNWAKTSLGPIKAWPQSLITTVNLLLQSPVPIVLLWGPDGIMIYNDAYSEFAGKRHPKLLGSKVLEGWPEVADFNRNVMATVRKGETLIYEDQRLTLYRNNEAEEVFMDLTYSPVTNESGTPNGVMAIVIETTQRRMAEQRQKEAEKSLRAERERLHAMFMQAPASIAILHGPDHVFELANPMYLELIGHKDVIGKSVREAIPEVIDQGFIEILDDVYKSGKAFHGTEIGIELLDENKKKHMNYLNFVYQPSFDVTNQVVGILVHAVNVTDQVKARKQVEEIANLNKTITDNATTGLMIMDKDHYATYMNPAAEKITGYTLTQLKKKRMTLHDIIHYKRPDGSAYPVEDCPTSTAQAGNDTVLAEDHFVRADGSMYPVFIMSTPIISNGVMVGIVEEIRDITKEKEAEQEILNLNKELEDRVLARTVELTAANKELGRSNEELQDFAYVASHDLQEPLRKIAAFSNLLNEDFADILPSEASAYLQGIQKSSARMRTLITDLLNYSRVATKGQPFEIVNLPRLVTEVLDDLATRISETKATITIGNLSGLDGDPLQLRLLLQNLISNALKYAKKEVPPEISIHSEINDDRCTIYVIDNGIGFDEKYLDRIFTIFQRLHGKTEYEGTGVGLAICKKIVERHGGSITAKSKPGEGSTFIVTLPLRHQGSRRTTTSEVL